MPRIPHQNGRAEALAAAGRLFYAHGTAAVSVDAVAAEAGLTKRAVYYHFPTKRDLVEAWLDSADEVALDLLKTMATRPPKGTSPHAAHPFSRILEGLRKWLRSGRFHGCAFLRAARAHADDARVLELAARHKAASLAWLTATAADAGCDHPHALARQFQLLLDGVLSSGHLYDADVLIDTAQATLRALLDTSFPITSPTTSPPTRR